MRDRGQAAGYAVDTVLLIGGSSYIPLIREKLQATLGLEPTQYANRDIAVALGAAYYAQTAFREGEAITTGDHRVVMGKVQEDLLLSPEPSKPPESLGPYAEAQRLLDEAAKQFRVQEQVESTLEGIVISSSEDTCTITQAMVKDTEKTIHQPQRPKMRASHFVNIFVGNLLFSVTEDHLRQLFEQYGEVEKVTLVTDRETGRSRGFAFVEMPDSQAAQSAIQGLEGKTLAGRTLTIYAYVFAMSRARKCMNDKHLCGLV
jgi:hypothetical protein